MTFVKLLNVSFGKQLVQINYAGKLLYQIYFFPSNYELNLESRFLAGNRVTVNDWHKKERKGERRRNVSNKSKEHIKFDWMKYVSTKTSQNSNETRFFFNGVLSNSQ